MSYIQPGKVEEFEDAVKKVLMIRGELLLSLDYEKILELDDTEAQEFIDSISGGSGKHFIQLREFNSIVESDEAKQQKIAAIAEDPKSVVLPPVSLETLYRISSLENSRILELQKDVKSCTDKMVSSLNLKNLVDRGNQMYHEAGNVGFTSTHVFYAIYEMTNKLSRFNGALAYLDTWMKAQANKELHDSVIVTKVDYISDDYADAETNTIQRRRKGKLRIASSVHESVSTDDDTEVIEKLATEDRAMMAKEEAESSVIAMLNVSEALREKFLDPPTTKRTQVTDLDAYRAKKFSKLSEKECKLVDQAYSELAGESNSKLTVQSKIEELFNKLQGLVKTSVEALNSDDYDTVQIKYDQLLDVIRALSPIMKSLDRETLAREHCPSYREQREWEEVKAKAKAEKDAETSEDIIDNTTEMCLSTQHENALKTRIKKYAR